jgi:predicted DNA-binding transcriptional regulator YafY
MARGDQLARQWKIIQALIASRRGSPSPIWRGWWSATRTVYRDLEALQVAGFPVTTEQDGHRMIWSLLDPSGTPCQSLEPAELMALYFGRSWPGFEGNCLLRCAGVAVRQIKSLLPADMLQLLDRAQESLAVAVSPAKPHEPYRAMIDLVSQAILQRRRLGVVYRAMHGRENTRRRVAPTGSCFLKGPFISSATAG